MPSSVRYAFGPFRLDPAEHALQRDGRPVRLTPKDLDVLVALVQHHGAVVRREQLFTQVWPGVVVEDCNLARHVATLRQALGDLAEAPTFIETLPKRGYRFVAPVRELQDQEGPATPDPPPVEAAGPAPGAAPPPASAVEVVVPGSTAEVDGAEPARPATLPVPPRRRLRPALMGLGAVAAFVLVGFLSVAWPTNRSGPIRTLVVPPIANLTGDPAQAYLAEALGELIVNDLGRLPELQVVSRGSARRFDRSDLPTREIGRELGVDGLLEAAVLKVEGRLRVTAELVDTRTEKLIWAEVFEAETCDLLDLQELLAEAVVEALGLDPARLRGQAGVRLLPGRLQALTCQPEAAGVGLP